MVSSSTLIICLMATILLPSPTWQCISFKKKGPEKTKKLCTPNPCKNNGSCYVNESGGEDYYCKCPFPMGGKDCKEAADDPWKTCGQHGNTVICFYDEKITSFSESKSNCEKMNMSLVKILDEETQNFIKNLYFLKNKKGFDDEHYLFIGLQRDGVNSSKFHWTDGSPLGSYQLWEYEDENICVGLDTWSDFYWLSVPCDQLDTFSTYYICARELSL